MKSNNLKPIEIGYGDEKVIFYTRLISVAEEEIFNLKFSDVADSIDKHQKNFGICKEALGEVSVSMPEKLVKEKGEFKRVPLVDDAETPAGAIEKFFAERTLENERIIRDAYFLFKSQLSPDSRFLPHSAS